MGAKPPSTEAADLWGDVKRYVGGARNQALRGIDMHTHPVSPLAHGERRPARKQTRPVRIDTDQPRLPRAPSLVPACQRSTNPSPQRPCSDLDLSLLPPSGIAVENQPEHRPIRPSPEKGRALWP
eukprot:1429130-Rhodomonas_salina.3